MHKEKITHIFNKNHIEILKIENPEKTSFYPNIPCIDYIHMAHEVKENNEKEIKEGTLMKCESPLGFYYYKPYKFTYREKKYTNIRNKIIVTFIGPGNIIYQLKYMTRYDDNIIDLTEDGTRPWDIVEGDKDFPDHMVEALLKDVNDFFIIPEINKTQFYERYNGWMDIKYGNYKKIEKNYKRIDAHSLKRKVMLDLFGSYDGPRFQSNESKILSHGFDLKYSFRKDKEKK